MRSHEPLSPEQVVMNSEPMSEYERTLMRAYFDYCAHHGHIYSSTWEMGHFVCLRCGTRAVCAVCVPQWPDTTLALHLCSKHQPKEETS
jgi:hypothetical protein